MEGFKKIIKMKTGGSVNNVYEAKKSSGDKDNIQKTKAIKAGPAAAPSKAAVKGKDVGAKTVGASGHKDPYIKSKESGKTPNAPSAAVKGRNKKATGTVNKFKTGGNVKKMAAGGALEQAALLNALPGKVNEIERARMAARAKNALQYLGPAQQSQFINQGGMNSGARMTNADMQMGQQLKNPVIDPGARMTNADIQMGQQLKNPSAQDAAIQGGQKRGGKVKKDKC